MESVLALANKCARVWRCSIFLLNLRKGTGGHTIGIHLDGALHFFDSNVGEFAFPIGSEGDLENYAGRELGDPIDRPNPGKVEPR